MTLIGTIKNAAYVVLFIILITILPAFFKGIGGIATRYFDPRTQVGVLPIRGILYNSHDYVKNLHTFFKDPSIKAILLKIECPGGAAGTANIIFNEIVTLKKAYPKPVVAMVENVCASGGYYIAAASDHIIAPPMAMVGSIGVALSYLFQLKEFVEQFKIKPVTLAAGEYKNTTNPFSTMTPEQTRMLQEELNDSYDQFINDISQQRPLSVQHASQWAEGKIFTGRQAAHLGLIDELGSHSQAIAAIKERANIETEIRWVYPPSKTGILNVLAGSTDDENESSFVAKLAHEICNVVESRYTTHLTQ